MNRGRKQMEGTTRRMVRLPVDLDASLERIAKAEACSVSVLVRRALIHEFFLPVDVTTGNTISGCPTQPTEQEAVNV